MKAIEELKIIGSCYPEMAARIDKWINDHVVIHSVDCVHTRELAFQNAFDEKHVDVSLDDAYQKLGLEVAKVENRYPAYEPSKSGQTFTVKLRVVTLKDI